MNNADLFYNSNIMSKYDAAAYLEEYFKRKERWKLNNITIIDIGSGDGSVSCLLKKYISPETTLLGIDKSEKMVNFANHRYGSKDMLFMLLDIEKELPVDFKCKFDIVFSSYTLHWIMNQERAFSNIYDLMNEDSDCLLIFLADNLFVGEVYRRLARNNKWTALLHDKDRFISPYIDCQEPEKNIREMMETIGFVDIDVTCKNKKYRFSTVDIMRNLLIAINPFNIPENLSDDFMIDYFEILLEMGVVNKINNNYELGPPFDYRLIVVHASKRITHNTGKTRNVLVKNRFSESNVSMEELFNKGSST